MDTPHIKLDQFLKLVGATGTGGEAKMLIQDGQVSVNGSVETRRGRKLVAGDSVSLLDETYTVALAPPGSPTSAGGAEGGTIQE